MGKAVRAVDRELTVNSLSRLLSVCGPDLFTSPYSQHMDCLLHQNTTGRAEEDSCIRPLGKRELDDTVYHFYRAGGTSCLCHKQLEHDSLSKTVSLIE